MISEFELDLWCNISGIQAVKLNLLCTDEQECKPLCYVIFLSRHQVSSPWPSRPLVQTGTEGAFLSQTWPTSTHLQCAVCPWSLTLLCSFGWTVRLWVEESSPVQTDSQRSMMMVFIKAYGALSHMLRGKWSLPCWWTSLWGCCRRTAFMMRKHIIERVRNKVNLFLYIFSDIIGLCNKFVSLRWI